MMRFLLSAAPAAAAKIVMSRQHNAVMNIVFFMSPPLVVNVIP